MGKRVRPLLVNESQWTSCPSRSRRNTVEEDNRRGAVGWGGGGCVYSSEHVYMQES